MTTPPVSDSLPRFPLLRGTTPLHEMSRLRESLGGSGVCPRLLVKRDDLGGPAMGGNKARKLEYLVADALERGATHLITVGGVQSNHARMTAAAARMAGLGCVLVLTSESAHPPVSGNLLLDRLLGASIRFVPPGPVPLGPNPHEDEEVAEAVLSIEREGGRPYVIPLGGSSALGVVGYVRAALELDDQLGAMEVAPRRVYFAAGSRGTQAGLELGRRLNGSSWEARGVAVSPGDPEKTQRVTALVRVAAKLIGAHLPIDVSPPDVITDQQQYGDGYGVPTPAGLEALRLLARTEGILLDPTYTAKAMAGLLADVRAGSISPAETVVFLHTGGAPALFASDPAVLLGSGAG